MKYLTVFKFNFTYDYYAPVVVNGAVDYQFAHTGKGLVLPSALGGMTLVTHVQLVRGGVIRSIKDAKGQELLVIDGGSYDMYVNAVAPELSDQSLVGWRHTLRSEKPRDHLALLEQLVNS